MDHSRFEESESKFRSWCGCSRVSDSPDPVKVDTKNSFKGEEVDNEEKRKILTRV